MKIVHKDDSQSLNYCVQNKFGSYDCTLCKIPLPDENAYEAHSKSNGHKGAALADARIMKHTDMPVAFLSIFEHNSNLLTWRETGCRI